jgi:glycosyltransferase involved in cell wall biosynthesis
MTTLPPPSNDRPRILFLKKFHYTRIVGGAEEQIRLLSTELARRGWDVHCTTETETPQEPGVIDGVTLHSLPDNELIWYASEPAIRKLMADLKPQVVYNRGFDVYTTMAMRHAPADCVKIWAAANDGDGFIGPRMKHIRSIYGTLRWIRNYRRWHTMFADAAEGVRKADFRFVQRKDQIEVFRKAGMECRLFRNVLASVAEADVQRHEGRPTVLWAASLKQWKRPEKFIELARRCRDTDAKFVMIGEIQEEKYRPIVQRAVEELPNFQYDGKIPATSVGQYFTRAHLMVNTSIDFEGFSNTFLQAWGRAVPVATLEVNPEHLLTEGGLGFCNSDFEALVGGVKSLLDNPVQRREIGRKAREFTIREFDLKPNVDKLEALLRERGIGVNRSK